MASIRKRGSSYLIVVSMGYDYNGKRIKPQQKTVHPPEELTPRQVEKWLNEQAVLFERECRHAPQPVQQLTLAKYIDLWLTDIAPGKLAKSTIRRDRQDIERILPALGHYKLTELRPEHFRNFYAELRKVISPDTKKPLSEYGKRFYSKKALVDMIENYSRYYNTRRVQRKIGVLTPVEKHLLYLAA